MIVADTSAVLALLDRDDRHHRALARLWRRTRGEWLLPWAILPEVDFLAGTHIGRAAQDAFLQDIADGSFAVEWGRESDLARAVEIHTRHVDLRLGLVDGVVLAIAERVRARAVATLDVRHFGAVALARPVSLLPRDA